MNVLLAFIVCLASCLAAPSSAPAAVVRVHPGQSGAPSPSSRTVTTERPMPVAGTASWYDDGGGLYAAMPGYDGKPYTAQVCGFEGGKTNCVLVTVRDFCRCYVGTKRERVIDLSPAAFRSLAPLSKGLVKVTVERLK